MARIMGPIVLAVVVVLIATLAALAQQSGQSSDPHHPPQQAPAPGQPAPGQPAPGAARGGMGMGGMMGMMGEMHHGRGGGPLGLCPTATEMLAQSDAKAASRSLKLCGDLLKAMGDVLLKHSAELAKTPAGPAPGARK
ncbi:MAG TPA: hypothetical protein VIE37_05025 [Methylomirabilota bacterium]|jgi:hypothetical protein